ncbi:hypothetical protein PHLGIDRAFT_97080 [Phlebiopsis gigantea 11061_1 CR5-6]|uniref:MAGE domain-containing protein n=1 Tax=Phlebiopsis gigantea (strain 11061_1 CR5-6) TaxID=745531 RepID=A0A0C3N9W1_PHLG1|nr:hypothetical protein PHLGIDRAFT_97080 [Phlebiopsis gigantea 11061_1 CR5-6]
MNVDGEGDLERKANDLVRLALFTENKHMPLRRDEISKKVMGSKSRRFGEVLARAQQILSNTFGMQLVELQTRPAEEEKDKKEDKAQEKNKDKNAPGIKKKAPTGTKSYILRSVLDPQLIKLATVPDDDLLRLEKGEFDADPELNAEDEYPVPEPTGAIIAWERGDQLQSIGLLYVVLSFILVHGRSISDNDLRTLLRRLRLTANTQVPRDARASLQHYTLDQFLSTAIRQGYLDRQRIGEAKGAQKKRGRASATQGGNNDDAVILEWRWGPRAMAEVGEQDIARFVADFMVERTRGDVDSEDDEGGNAHEDPETKKMRDGMLKGIGKAAGGNLAELL